MNQTTYNLLGILALLAAITPYLAEVFGTVLATIVPFGLFALFAFAMGAKKNPA